MLILDTNVALDWIVFRDPVAAPALDAAVGGGLVPWIASPAMQSEFERVVARGLRSRPSLDSAAARRAWRRHARIVEPAAPRGSGWICRDPADQMFLDLALSRPGCWLLTRDRALLVLARRATAVGVRIATPTGWVRHIGLA